MSEDVTKSLSGRDLKFVTFTVAGQNYCLDIQKIREIRRWTPVTPLPHASNGVLGVMNLRGAVIPIYDMASRLGLGITDPSERNVVIVVAMDDNLFGLLAETVQEILSVTEDQLLPTPDVKSESTREAIQGVISLADDMTRILDLRFVTGSFSRAVA
ncbi:chemotaxis protein CheW [Pseudoroseicyclus tamaricis]|uniref:Purine-binding chemotaxis protein CheW n=1 Tax=Pseudoroseicyclus tamaricis TaxID=2705421 RepID=A0A6B2JZ00_9RHOB|nr:chemotaxis protein CheW [Pseudoroseicyclus tamaricis]NDV01839.1 purine-binding chemotaxis protein CheW [Pseudoroseicyclus tamaricis]